MNKELHDELLKECDRLTKIIDREDEGSDLWKLAYGKKQDILDKMNAYNKVTIDYIMKENALEADMTLEKEKKKISWPRVGFEASMVLIPLLITIKARKDERHEMFDFDTHGHLTSAVGRQYRLLDFWKKR